MTIKSGWHLGFQHPLLSWFVLGGVEWIWTNIDAGDFAEHSSRQSKCRGAIMMARFLDRLDQNKPTEEDSPHHSFK